jgi:hypothetical protein
MAAIADQSSSELRVNLLARREWAKTVTGWRRRDALREIREIEDELEARGETVAAPKPKATPTTRRRYSRIYEATARVQMAAVGDTREEDPNLAMHEDRGDGLPLCGKRLWPAAPAGEWRRHGRGPVSCGNCANISGAPRTQVHEPLEHGDSVRTVSGGAIETNRSRH